jgi:signal transduction histidine kinase
MASSHDCFAMAAAAYAWVVERVARSVQRCAVATSRDRRPLAYLLISRLRRVVLLVGVFFVTCTLAAVLVAPRLLARYPMRLVFIAIGVASLLLPVVSHASRSVERRLIRTRKPAELHSRLRRDLHDGLGPTVTAAAMRIETARRLFPEDPGAADILLAQAHAELHDAISHVREILCELTPGRQLHSLTLGEALRNLAGRFQQASGGRLQILVNCPYMTKLAPNIKYALYQIVSEAVTNVAKHSGATVCTICITPSTHGVCVSVSDNGIGLSAEPAHGIGLASMHERTIELGGECVIRPGQSGGTQVLVHIPFGAYGNIDDLQVDETHERSLR